MLWHRVYCVMDGHGRSLKGGIQRLQEGLGKDHLDHPSCLIICNI